MGSKNKTAVANAVEAAVEAMVDVVEAAVEEGVHDSQQAEQSAETATETTTAVAEPVVTTKEQSLLTRAVIAWQTSNSVQEAVEKMGIDPKTKQPYTKERLQGILNPYRQPKYDMIDKVDAEGKTVYQLNEDKTPKLDKKNKPVPVQVRRKDAQGNDIILRQALNLKNMPRGRQVSSGFESNLEEIAAALGVASTSLVK
jgi:hypothetical protein